MQQAPSGFGSGILSMAYQQKQFKILSGLFPDVNRV
jgi:hypothetical protein